MPHFIEIGGNLKDKCYVLIPDSIWSELNELQQKQITEAVEKGFIADAKGGIGIKKSPRYHISIKSDYRLCMQKMKSKSPFTSETVPSATANQDNESKVSNVTRKCMVFDREKDHKTLNSA
jgi:hypothetical protein